MQELIKFIRLRKLIIACGIFIVCLFIGFSLPDTARLPVMIVSAVLFTSAAAVYIIFKSRKIVTGNIGLAAFLLSAVFSASLVSYLYFGIHCGRVQTLTDGVHTYTAVVVDVEYQTVYSSTYLIEVTDTDKGPLNFKARLETQFASDYEELEIIRFSAEMTGFSVGVAGFDERAYNTSKGILLCAETDTEPERIGKSLADTAYIARRLNRHLRDMLYYHISDSDAAGFISGTLLGNRDDVSPTIKRDFRTLGLSHMLALSGLHLSILYGAYDGLMKFLHIRKRVRLTVGMVIVPAYMILTGLSPSVMRGGLMLMIAAVLQLMRFSYEPITALFCSVSAICLLNPSAVTDIGLIMSFGATLGIITLGSYLIGCTYRLLNLKERQGIVRKLFRITGSCAEALMLTLSALIFTLPVTWIYFGEFSISGIIATPLAAAFLSLMLSAASLMLIFSPIRPAAQILSRFVTLIYNFTAELTEITAVPEMMISLRYRFTKYIAVLFVVLFIILMIRGHRKMTAFFAPFGICAVLFALSIGIYSVIDSASVSAAYVKYRNNDMIVLNSGGMGLICDISDGSSRPLRESEYILSDRFMLGRIDTYMLTHYHQRHIGSFISFSERAYIDHLLIPYPEDEDDLGISAALTEVALERGIKVAMYRQGEPFSYGRTEITLCEEDDVGYSGHPIIALSIKAGDTGLLYAGSAAYNSQAYGFCEYHADNSETVILGAHGPKQKFKPAAGESDSVKYLCISDSTRIPVSGFGSAKVDILESSNNAHCRVFKIE